MSPGSEPERDDTGLPPVDIEIPDDARELDRDVQSYHRELRALRRQARQNRWRRSLGKDSIVVPLLACCLILALITGTLLTVFTATSGQGLAGLPGSGANSGLATGPGQPAPRVVAGGPLPHANITVAGRAPVPLAKLRRAMLILIPQGCGCGSTVAWLSGVAASTHATAAYVVYSPETRAEVERLYSQLAPRARAALTLAEDAANALTSPASFPAGITATQLTAVLVAPDGTVSYASDLSPRDSRTRLVQAITS